MNMHNFPLGPAKPGDGPSPDRDCSASPGQGLPSDPWGRAELTPGPAAWRDYWAGLADAIAAPFERTRL